VAKSIGEPGGNADGGKVRIAALPLDGLSREQEHRMIRAHERTKALAGMRYDTASLQRACEARGQHRRASRGRPVRQRGSRRTAGAPTRGDPDDGDGDPEPPGVTPQAGRRTAGVAP
jgi:hypothetical protein